MIITELKCPYDAEITIYYKVSGYVLDRGICEKSSSKICGISLKSNETQDLIDDKLFDFYLKQNCIKNFQNIYVPQKRYKKNVKNLNVNENITNVSFSNKLTLRRYVDFSEPSWKTYPYGFNTEN